MEFLELLNEINTFIPEESANISSMITTALPYLVLAFSLLACLFGYKLHRLWMGTLAFIVGFFIGFSPCIFFEGEIAYYCFLALGLVCGSVAAFFSHKLHKIQLFLTNAFFAFAVIPDLLATFIPSWLSLIIGFLLAIAIGVFAAKYKYIVTVFTTAISGSVSFVPALMKIISVDKNLITIIFTVLLALIGIGFQFFFIRKSLKKEEKAQSAH